jgi:hypothetical protein
MGVSGADGASGYLMIPVLAPGEVVFRDPRVSRYSKNSSIVISAVDFVVLSMVSMVSFLRKYVLISEQTIVQQELFIRSTSSCVNGPKTGYPECSYPPGLCNVAT